jgi:methylmalonyl-CoA/ethylmalonyl-CoA epimerase
MNLRFHHIGVACRDLNSECKLLSVLGYTAEGQDFADPVQGVAGRFLAGGGPRLELLTPLAQQGVLTPWLKANIKLYHLAYEIEDLEGGIAGFRKQGAKLVVSPVAATAFAQRRISFLMLPNLLLIELIAADSPDRLEQYRNL